MKWSEIVASHQEELKQRAVTLAARRLAKECLPDMRKMIRSMVEEEVRKYVQDRLATEFDKALVETDDYGQVRPGGKSLTIPELVQQQLQKYLQQKVNDHGHETSAASGCSRARYLVSQIAEGAIRNHFRHDIDIATKEFKERLQVKLSAAFRQAFVEMCTGAD